MNDIKILSAGFVILVCLITMRFWSILIVPDSVFDVLELICIGLVCLIFFHNLPEINRLDIPFFPYVKALLLITILLSSLGALVFHNQQFHQSLWRQRAHLLWLLYPVLHILDVKPQKLIRMMLIFGVVWGLINIIQQFTYPSYLFATRTEGKEAKEELLRAGVYRFMPNLFQYGLFLGFYSYQKFLVSKRPIYILGFSLALIGFYYFGTRQFLVGYAVCLIILTLMQKGAQKMYGIALLSIAAFVVLINQDLILGSFIEMTQGQLGSDDYIRYLAGNFFLFEYWPHWLAIFTGNGLAYISSNYGTETEYIHEVLAFYASDVGIIGSLNTFGVFYIAVVFITLYKIIRTSLINHEVNYLKLFAINAFLLLLLTEYFMSPPVIPFWCIILFLVDKASRIKINTINK